MVMVIQGWQHGHAQKFAHHHACPIVCNVSRGQQRTLRSHTIAGKLTHTHIQAPAPPRSPTEGPILAAEAAQSGGEHAEAWALSAAQGRICWDGPAWTAAAYS
eukprot:1136861-Pelagomonas_calceolata.AAC.17